MHPSTRDTTSRRVAGAVLAITGIFTLVTVFWFPLNSLPYAPSWWDFALLPHFSLLVTSACWLLTCCGVAATAAGATTTFRRHSILDIVCQAIALFTLFSTVLSAGAFIVMMDGLSGAWKYGNIGFFTLGPLWLGALASIVIRFATEHRE